jgi:membrane protease YdiL (CAAX protease family)
MQKFFQQVKTAWLNYHQFHKDDGSIKRQTRDNLIFYGVALFCFYSILTTCVLGAASLTNRLTAEGSNKALWVVLLSVATISAGALLCRQVSLRVLFKQDRAKRKIVNLLKDWSVTLISALEMLVVYLILANWFSLRIELVSSKLNWQSSAIYLSIIILFVFAQPVFEGYLFRGFLTRLLSSIYIKDLNHKKLFVFWVSVLIGSILHVGFSSNLALLLFTVFQMMVFQWVSQTRGLRNSIGLNICFNLLLVSFL